MDLKGIELRHEVATSETNRSATATVTTTEGLSNSQKALIAKDRLATLARAAEWHGGKGPRSVTDPIVLKKLDDGGQFIAKISTFDLMGKSVDNGSAVMFETNVYFVSPTAHDVLYASEFFDGFHYRDGLGQTIDMLQTAMQDPELNPRFAVQLIAAANS